MSIITSYGAFSLAKNKEVAELRFILLDACSDLSVCGLLLNLLQRHGGIVISPAEGFNFPGPKSFYIGNFRHDGELEGNKG